MPTLRAVLSEVMAGGGVETGLMIGLAGGGVANGSFRERVEGVLARGGRDCSWEAGTVGSNLAVHGRIRSSLEGSFWLQKGLVAWLAIGEEKGRRTGRDLRPSWSPKVK
jgi:hypothetical protein